ncbi:MAG: diaminopimelate epimerase [Candidatus Riflebacteria bacterium]|nr:diaminopimelate epimerase [Candidatus Riflebacteria bacterium]
MSEISFFHAHPVQFCKMHHLGNHFVFFDELAEKDPSRANTMFAPLKHPEAVRLLCDPARGVGADGVVFLRHPLTASSQARMQIFNRDGSEAEICGNALLCMGHLYRLRHGVKVFPISIEAGGRNRQLFLDDSRDEFPRYRLDLGTASFGMTASGECDSAGANSDKTVGEAGQPTAGPAVPPYHEHQTLIWKDIVLSPIYVNIGNPHAVLFFERPLSQADMEDIGPWLENHPRHPGGINVEFVTTDGPQSARVHVWERGCGMTNACGTGAAAVCAAGVREGRLKLPVTIHMPGGQLQVDIDSDSHISLTGTVQEIANGELSPFFLRQLFEVGQ